MSDAPDLVADAKDRVRLGASLALRGLASIETRMRSAAERIGRRTPVPTRADIQALRASITDLTRAVRDLNRS